MTEEQQKRAQTCNEEINAVLKKYNCNVIPTVYPTPEPEKTEKAVEAVVEEDKKEEKK